MHMHMSVCTDDSRMSRRPSLKPWSAFGFCGRLGNTTLEPFLAGLASHVL